MYVCYVCLTRVQTHRVLARQLGHVRVLEGNFGGGEFDAAHKLLIFTVRELLIVKASDPARPNAPTKPCNRGCQLFVTAEDAGDKAKDREENQKSSYHSSKDSSSKLRCRV